MGPLIKLLRAARAKKAPEHHPDWPAERLAKRAKNPRGPRTEMSPEAMRRHVESLFDIPAPYKDYALEIDTRMGELEKAHAAGKSGMTEQQFVNEMNRLGYGRNEMMAPKVHSQGLFEEGFFPADTDPESIIPRWRRDWQDQMNPPDPEPEMPQWYFDMKYRGQ